MPQLKRKPVKPTAMSDMPAFSETVACIREHLPGIDLTRPRWDTNSLIIDASDDAGYPVILRADARSLKVEHSFWHDRFGSAEEAAKCFILGLTPAAYLEVSVKGRSPYKWTMFTHANGEWASIGHVHLMIYPYWRRPRVRSFQNAWTSIAPLRPWVGEQFADAPRAGLGPDRSITRIESGGA